MSGEWWMVGGGRLVGGWRVVGARWVVVGCLWLVARCWWVEIVGCAAAAAAAAVSLRFTTFLRSQARSGICIRDQVCCMYVAEHLLGGTLAVAPVPRMHFLKRSVSPPVRTSALLSVNLGRSHDCVFGDDNSRKPGNPTLPGQRTRRRQHQRCTGALSRVRRFLHEFVACAT